MAKQKAGEGNCPACNQRIVWRLSDSGALSCFCQDCDFQGYAKAGTLAKTLIQDRIGATPTTKPAVQTDPVQKPEPAPKPAPQSAFGVFGL